MLGVGVSMLFGTAGKEVAEEDFVSSEIYSTPRNQTVVIGQDDPGYKTNYDRANPFMPEGVQWASGWHQCAREYNWMWNLATGEKVFLRITGWEEHANYMGVTVHIRPGVKWNDGTPFTSKDWAFTIGLMLDTDNAAIFGTKISDLIESIQTPDDYTVVINYKYPDPRAAQTVTYGADIHIAAEHIWRDKDIETFANFPPVETGPYRLKEVIPDREMYVWERRDDYWGTEVLGIEFAPRYLIWVPNPAVDLVNEEYLQGNYDYAGGMNWDRYEALKQRTDDVVYSAPLGGAYGYQFNVANYPMSVPELRWAISYAIDRETLLRLVPDRNTLLSAYPQLMLDEIYSFYKPFRPAADRAMARITREFGYEYKRDVAKAQQMLDDLGFIDRDDDGIRETPDGTKLVFSLLARNDQEHEFIYTDVLTENLAEIGIEVKARIVGGTTWHDVSKVGDFDIMVGGIYYYEEKTHEMLQTWENYHSDYGATPLGTASPAPAPQGRLRYCNEELDALIEEWRTLAPSNPRTEELTEECYYILFRDLPTIAFTARRGITPFSTKYWTGWPTWDNEWSTPKIGKGEFIITIAGLKPSR